MLETCWHEISILKGLIQHWDTHGKAFCQVLRVFKRTERCPGFEVALRFSALIFLAPPEWGVCTMLNHDAGLTTDKLPDPDTMAHDATYFCAVDHLPVLETNGRPGCRVVCVAPGFSFLASGKPEPPHPSGLFFHLFWLLLPRLII